MPSSSTRNTQLERNLADNIRLALIHLQTGAQREDFEDVEIFSQYTLDADNAALSQMFRPAKPVFSPGVSVGEYNEAVAHRNYVKALWQTSWDCAQSERLRRAAWACADVGVELGSLYMRGEEARMWAEKGEELLQRAYWQLAKEERIEDARKASKLEAGRVEARRDAEEARMRARREERARRGSAVVEVIEID